MKECKPCGLWWEFTFNYCPECGTELTEIDDCPSGNCTCFKK